MGEMQGIAREPENKAMAQVSDDDLDAFFAAAENNRPEDMEAAAKGISSHYVKNSAEADVAPKQVSNGTINYDLPPLDEEETRLAAELDDDFDGSDTEGKFIAVDPAVFPGYEEKADQPFVLVPAHIHTYVPWWGWVTIGLGLLVMVAGVMIMPGVSMNRMIDRLDDPNEENARLAMRHLVTKADEHTVKKLYSTASSPKEGLKLRLRAVDTMTLIERIPEVDRALLRLELSGDTHEQVREAAIAARKQREAYRARRSAR